MTTLYGTSYHNLLESRDPTVNFELFTTPELATAEVLRRANEEARELNEDNMKSVGDSFGVAAHDTITKLTVTCVYRYKHKHMTPISEYRVLKFTVRD